MTGISIWDNSYKKDATDGINFNLDLELGPTPGNGEAAPGILRKDAKGDDGGEQAGDWGEEDEAKYQEKLRKRRKKKKKKLLRKKSERLKQQGLLLEEELEGGSIEIEERKEINDATTEIKEGGGEAITT